MSSKPGEKALEAIKKLNAEVSLFKVPRAPQLTKKTKMKILTEEQYIQVCVLIAPSAMCTSASTNAKFNSHEIAHFCSFQELGNIIQKDFFPDLEKLKAQNQYLEAMEKNDVIKLRELYAKYSGKTPTNQLGGM